MTVSSKEPSLLAAVDSQRCEWPAPLTPLSLSASEITMYFTILFKAVWTLNQKSQKSVMKHVTVVLLSQLTPSCFLFQVLQLRLQQRRTQEQLANQGLIPREYPPHPLSAGISGRQKDPRDQLVSGDVSLSGDPRESPRTSRLWMFCLLPLPMQRLFLRLQYGRFTPRVNSVDDGHLWLF